MNQSVKKTVLNALLVLNSIRHFSILIEVPQFNISKETDKGDEEKSYKRKSFKPGACQCGRPSWNKKGKGRKRDQQGES